MGKKFYVCLLRGTCTPDASEVHEFSTSEEVEDFLLENGPEVDGNPDDVWVIFGERFRFTAIRKPTAFMLKGPD